MPGKHTAGFADKKEKPSIKEYLSADLSEVLDRLNKNPSRLESEAAFIDAVITVRHARIIERLNMLLVVLTGVAAAATAALVFVPFFTPSLEPQRVNAKIGELQRKVGTVKAEIESLRKEGQRLKNAVSASSRQHADLSLHPSRTSGQMLSIP